MDARPYSLDALAERWGCSAEKIRRMVATGEIAGFRIGRLIRIPASEVERVECQNTALCDIEDDGPSRSRTASEDGFASRLARMTKASPKHAPAISGAPGNCRSATR